MSSEPVPSPEELTETLQLAIEAHRADRKPDAEKLYMRVLRHQPRNAEALNLLGVLAAQAGDFRRARELIKASLAEAPNSADYRFQYAHVLQLSGQAGVAQGYREALECDPRHLPSLVNLGNLLLDRDEVDEAASLLQTATEVDSRAVPAFEGLGLARQRQGRHDDAIAALSHAVSLDPDAVMAQAVLGDVFREAGRVEDAVRQLRQVTDRYADNADLQANLGLALLTSGEPRAALDSFAKALALDPRQVRALAAKPLAHRELGEDDLADALFDFDHLLATTKVTTVPGFDDVAAFNTALAKAVQSHPSLTQYRSSTITTLGAETKELFDGTGGVFAILGTLIQQAVNNYFAVFNAPDGARFPVPLPKGCVLHARGTVLQHGGSQSSHYHPRGVVSGIYFVQVPASESGAETAAADSGAADSRHPGAIEFGRGTEDLNLTKPAKVQVVPAEDGMLLLFPSYLWQRTIPFLGDGEHISIAFEVVPLD